MALLTRSCAWFASVYLFVFLSIFLYPTQSAGFEESIKVEPKAEMIEQRQQLYDRFDRGEITREQYFEEARRLETGSPRSKYIDDLFNDPDLIVTIVDKKTGLQKDVPVFTRSGSPAVEGRGILSDEDIMINMGLGLTDQEMDEYYKKAIKKLKDKGVDIRIDSLAAQTTDDVVIWNPSRRQRASIGGKDAYFITGVQFNEYAPGAAAGGMKNPNLTGISEEIILDNLNKGKGGFLNEPTHWLHGDEKMTHRIWDELRLAAKDTYRSLEVAGLQDGSMKELYEKYVKLAKGESMPSEIGIYKRGASIEERLAGARKEMDKMRQAMRESLDAARKKTASQMTDLMRRLKNMTDITDVDELFKLAQEARDAGDRMHRIALNYDFLAKQPGAKKYLGTLDFPTNYLAKLNKNAGRIRKVLDGANLDLLSFFMKNVPPGDDLKKTIAAILDGRMDDLPKKAKDIYQDLIEAAGLRLIGLEEKNATRFLYDLKKQNPSMRLKPGDKTVSKLLDQLESASDPTLIKIFGETNGPKLIKTRNLISQKVKKKVIDRFLGGLAKIQPWTVDKKTRLLLLGDPGESGIKAMGLDAVIGVATAMYMTASIMEQDLSPAEENRLIHNAWISSMPLVGDFFQAGIEGIDAYYEGSMKKGVTSGLYLTIGVAYMVPGYQIPAMIASLAMAAVEFGSSAWEVAKDRYLLSSWLYSGKWNYETGKLLGLFDARGNARPVPPSPAAFSALIETGDTGYHSSLIGGDGIVASVSGDTSIRDTIYAYTERAVLAYNSNVVSLKTAIEKLYPDFDLDTNLRLPLNTGRTNFAAHIIEKGGIPARDAAMYLFVRLKKDLYEPAIKEALIQIKKDTEAEFQARYMVGEPVEVFAELAALEQRLGLQLVDNVNNLFEAFISWSFQAIKSPWVKHSIPRRHMELAKKYLFGYREIEADIKLITERIEKWGLKPPRNYNLTGYLDIDQPRIKDLIEAYQNALTDSSQAVKKAALGIQIPGYSFDPKGPCASDLFKRLAQLAINRVHTSDLKNLFKQQAGLTKSARETRDALLKSIQQKVDQDKPVLATMWTGLGNAFEKSYAWYQMGLQSFTTMDSSALESMVVYSDAIQATGDREQQLLAKYDEVVASGEAQLIKCIGSLIVHLRRLTKDNTTAPVQKGKVVLIDRRGNRIELKEKEEGNYSLDKLPAGTYTLKAEKQGLVTTEGEKIYTDSLVQPATKAGETPKPTELTVYLVAPKGVISVVATNEDLQPVPGTKFRLEPDGAEPLQWVDAKKDGTYIFPDLEPGTYKVQAAAECHQGETSYKIVLDTEDPSRSTDMPVSLTLVPYYSKLAVTVTDPDGIPLTDASVSLGQDSGTTDSNGSILFEDVAPTCADETATLTVSAEGYPVKARQVAIEPDGPGQKFSENVIIEPGGTIRVKVTAADDGKPIPDAAIEIATDSDQTCYSDNSGQCVFNLLAPDYYYVRATKEGYQANDAVEVNIGKAGAPLLHDIQINLHRGILLKVFVEDKTGGGPIANARVAVDGNKCLAPTGSCEFNRIDPDISHTIVGWAACFEEKTITSEFDAATTRQTIYLKLEPALSLRVEAREKSPGAPLIKDGASITLTGPGIDRTVSGPARVFSSLEPGSFKAAVSAPGYVDGSASVTLDAADDACDRTLQVKLEPVRAALSVAVSLKQSQETEGPPPEIKISVNGPKSISASGASASFSGLPSGKYTIRASANGYQSASVSKTLEPTEPGQTYQATLLLKGLAMDPLEDGIAEKIKKLIQEGKLEQAHQIYMKELSAEEAEKVAGLLSDDEMEKLFSVEEEMIETPPEVTPELIASLLEAGDVETAIDLISNCGDEVIDKLLAGLTDSQIDELFEFVEEGVSSETSDPVAKDDKTGKKHISQKKPDKSKKKSDKRETKKKRNGKKIAKKKPGKESKKTDGTKKKPTQHVIVDVEDIEEITGEELRADLATDKELVTRTIYYLEKPTQKELEYTYYFVKKKKKRSSVKHGRWTSWRRNGVKKQERIYRHGKVLMLIYYHDNGLLYSTKANNEDGSYRSKRWNEKGILVADVGWNSQGAIDGHCVRWYDTGQKSTEGHWVNGEEEGLHRHWYMDGRLHYDIQFRSGKREGKYKYWRLISEEESEDGNEYYWLREVSEYRDDLLDGTKTLYYDNGQKESVYRYRRGKKHGKGQFWHYGDTD